ncbi:hydrolase [Patescibacteria group bacterium]
MEEGKTKDESFETGCCKRFNPEPWDEKEVTWDNKLFYKDHAMSFFHMPLNYGSVMKRSVEKIKAVDAFVEDPLMLSDEKSKWGSDIYIAVTKDVPDSEMVKISGTFLTKVFEGGYKNIKNWVGEMEEFVESRGKKTKKLYFYYTMCPGCAKAYGQNYVVLIAQV